MADFETPVTREFPIIPTIVEGAMSNSAPFLASEEFQTDMGFPSGEETGQLIDGWKDKFLELLDRERRYHVGIPLPPGALAGQPRAGVSGSR